MDLAQRQHFIKIRYIPAEQRNREARRAFEVCGAKTQSAVPALIEIANRNVSRTSQYCAIDALAFVGPPAKEAVRSLLQWATNADYEVRYCAIRALGRIGAEPGRVLPLLINALQDPSFVVRNGAVWSLADFGPDATNALKAIDPEAAAKAGVQ